MTSWSSSSDRNKYIYFSRERTTMTLETSENVIFFRIKYRRVACCVHSINVFKLAETRATVPKIFFHKFGRHVCWHFIAFYRARLSRRIFKARAIALFWNQFTRGQKTIGSHLNPFNQQNGFIRFAAGQFWYLVTWRAGLAQWSEHSPCTKMAWVRFPDLPSYVDWVCCFSTLFWEVWFAVIQFDL